MNLSLSNDVSSHSSFEISENEWIAFDMLGFYDTIFLSGAAMVAGYVFGYYSTVDCGPHAGSYDFHLYFA